MDYDAFLRYRGNWLLWRALGHKTSDGLWVAPLSFAEANHYPKQMIDIFLELDRLYGKMERTYLKNKTKQETDGKLD